MPTRRIGPLAEREITETERRAAGEILDRRKVALFIVAYNAERHLESVVERIPRDIAPRFADIFVIDDSSTDETFRVATRIRERFSLCPLHVYRTPFNRGYGGNQKLGYLHCVERGYDIAILLHGDGQYPPEYIPRVLAAFDEDTDAVFASRMITKRRALEGGMPCYKWIGNQLLTAFENSLLGTRLSEFHTGFRAYRVRSLAGVPFQFNSDDFHFDTEIVVQAVARKWRIREVAIPAHYGGETCHVNGLRYALNCAKAVVKYRLVNLGLYYERNYDFSLFEDEEYQFKRSPHSLHQFVIGAVARSPGKVSIELGANRGILSSHVAQRSAEHCAVDLFAPDRAGRSRSLAIDLNGDFSRNFRKKSFDVCIALDVIEHLDEPEHFLSEVFRIMKTGGILYISTANICYLPMRISLLLGQFNYGKRGILDRTHKRLFSMRGLRKLCAHYGFKVKMARGFAPPITDMIRNTRGTRILESVHTFLSRRFPRLFAYNFLLVAERMDELSDIFAMTVPGERPSDAAPSSERFPSLQA